MLLAQPCDKSYFSVKFVPQLLAAREHNLSRSCSNLLYGLDFYTLKPAPNYRLVGTFPKTKTIFEQSSFCPPQIYFARSMHQIHGSKLSWGSHTLQAYYNLP